MTEQNYRPDIDGLRAYAVLSVVGFHAFPNAIPGGFIGVDIFFVISGFLITSIILREVKVEQFSFLNFYSRRARRIFPALIVVLAFCYAVGWFLLWANDFRQLGKHVLGAVGFASNLVLWRESGYFDAASDTKPLLHLWSLGIEEQFYVIWPLLILWVSKFRRNLVALMAGVTIASFTLNVALIDRFPVATFYLPATRFWELMVGSILAYVRIHTGVSANPGFRSLQSVAGAIALVAPIWILDAHSAFPGWWALLPTGGAALIIFAGPMAWINQTALSWRPLVFVGLISYPLYLWHWPILSFLKSIAGEQLALEIRVAAVAASIVFAWLTYEFIERRIRYGRKRFVTPALALTLVSIGVFGLGTWMSGGIHWRYPRDIQNIDQYTLMSPAISLEWRRYRCMLESESAFQPECIDRMPAQMPLIVLWGDSHAAALFPGIRDQQNLKQFRVAQFNTSRCPPILGYVSTTKRLHNPQCIALNNFVLAKIKELKPTVVIMTAYWDIYDPAFLRDTLMELKRMGVRKVILVGDVPIWNGNPSRIVFRLYRQNGTVPQRVVAKNFRIPYESDLRIAQIAKSTDTAFVSLLDQFCDATSCIAFVEGNLIYSDPDHLSPPGAVWVTRKLQTAIFE